MVLPLTHKIVNEFKFLEGQMKAVEWSILDNNSKLPFKMQYSFIRVFKELYKSGESGEKNKYTSDLFKTFSSPPLDKADYTSIMLEDVIDGYYNLYKFIIELKDIVNREKRSEKEKEITEIIELYDKFDNCKIFHIIKELIRFDNIFPHIDKIRKTINCCLLIASHCGIKLPDYQLEQVLIECYIFFRKEKTECLKMSIKDFTINDTLYLINYVHGSVTTNEGINFETIAIPRDMNFYRIMSSEYGSFSCTTSNNTLIYVNQIQKFLNNKLKNIKKTDKNNEKLMKHLIFGLLKIINQDMNIRKKGVLLKNSVQVSKPEKNRYNKSEAHVHSFLNESAIILKEFQVNLSKEKNNINTIYVVHPSLGVKVNLIDYIDIKIIGNSIFFNLKNIIDLIKDIKNVLFIDLSCSGSMSNLTENKKNTFKQVAKNIEGNSITQKIKKSLPLSPFNEISPIVIPHTKHLSLNKSISKYRSRSKRRSI